MANMATREEAIQGVQFLIQEGRRVAADLTEADWARAVDFDGWKNKEVLAHVAGVGAIVIPMVNGVAGAPAGVDAGAAVDIDALNAGIVAQRAGKSAAELADEVATSYSGVVEFLKTAPDDLLNKPVTFRGYKDVPVSDVIMRMVVLHGLGHIYAAYSAVMDQK
jgi:hypothetical protein